MGSDPISLAIASPQQQRAAARAGRVELHRQARTTGVVLDAAVLDGAHVAEVRRRRVLAIRRSVPRAIPYPDAIHVDRDEALIGAARRFLSKDRSAVANGPPRREVHGRSNEHLRHTRNAPGDHTGHLPRIAVAENVLRDEVAALPRTPSLFHAGEPWRPATLAGSRCPHGV